MNLIKIMHSEGQTVPYDLVKQHEEQVMSNHGQTVDMIMDRGGLDWVELYCVLNDIPFNSKIPIDKARFAVLDDIYNFNNKEMITSIKANKLGLRPCNVNYEIKGEKISRKAYFHQWCSRSDILTPSPMVGGRPGGVLMYVTGLVEYEDGSVAECSPKSIIFTDANCK
jgi:hypothetical protein